MKKWEDHYLRSCALLDAYGRKMRGEGAMESSAVMAILAEAQVEATLAQVRYLSRDEAIRA